MQVDLTWHFDVVLGNKVENNLVCFGSTTHTRYVIKPIHMRLPM